MPATNMQKAMRRDVRRQAQRRAMASPVEGPVEPYPAVGPPASAPFWPRRASSTTPLRRSPAPRLRQNAATAWRHTRGPHQHVASAEVDGGGDAQR